jgi:hypothetical protein
MKRVLHAIFCFGFVLPVGYFAGQDIGLRPNDSFDAGMIAAAVVFLVMAMTTPRVPDEEELDRELQQKQKGETG